VRGYLQRIPGLYFSLGLGLVVLAVALYTRPLMPIDETRYLSVAWEMWTRGDWLVPHINGVPYAQKPPLLFWLIDSVWRITGVSELGARLVAPAFGMISVALTWVLARLLWPERTRLGHLAALVLVSINLWTFSTTLTMFDSLLATFALLGVIGVVRAARGMRHAWSLLALALGGGLLSKGPVILIHVLLLALALPWIARSTGAYDPDSQWYRRLSVALLVGVGIIAAWVIPAAIEGGAAYRDTILWQQTVGRMSHSFAHQRPVWWYLVLAPGLLFPWIFAWFGRVGWRQLWLDAGMRLCLIWTLGAGLLFSLISGKQIHYLIPELPGFALMTAYMLDHKLQTVKLRYLVGLTVALMVGIGVLLLNGAVLKFWRGCDACFQPSPVWGIILLLSAAMVTWMGWLGIRFRAISLGMILLWSVVWAATGPFVTRNYDVVTPAQRIHELQRKGETVVHLGAYHAQFQFLGRLTQPLQVIPSKGQLRQWLHAGHRGHVLLYLSRDTTVPLTAAELVVPFRARFAVLFPASVLRDFDDSIWAQFKPH